MEDLIKRLTEAEEGSRELDAEIAVAVFERVSTDDDLIYAKLPHKDDGCAPGTFWRKSRSGASLHTAPHYTTSLDAALELVPEGWRFDKLWHGPLLENKTRVWSAQVWNQDKQRYSFSGFTSDRHANTPALALCIAALRARNGRG